MRIPAALTTLIDYGSIDEVLRPLMSGKEAQIYLVRSGGEHRVVKVYKEAQNRTFKNRADYTEGRKVRNSRDQRAMGRGSRHGRAQAEAAWRNTEVDVIYRLRDAGVRVPTPYHFVDGVLVMEMITDAHGDPAPRLGDVVLEADEARAVFDTLLAEVVRMLAAGVVHGDLSDFNVLMGRDGPVIIDFPQAVDASANRNARTLLLRDVDNLHRFMARHAPGHRAAPYAQEMWALYERGELTPDTTLSGRYKAAEHKVSTDAVLGLIGDAARDERRRREALGLSMRGAAPEPEAPRPPSRYAQKREALVAARLLEAANKPPAQRIEAANKPSSQRLEAANKPSSQRGTQARSGAGQVAQPHGRPQHRDNSGQRPARHAAGAPKEAARPHTERKSPEHAATSAPGEAHAQKRRRRRRKRKPSQVSNEGERPAAESRTQGRGSLSGLLKG